MQTFFFTLLVLQGLFVFFVLMDHQIETLSDKNKIKKWWKKHFIDEDPYDNGGDKIF